MLLARHRWTHDNETVIPMSKFALLLNVAPNRYEGVDQDAYMAIMKDYIAWVEMMTAEGVYQVGHRLALDGGKTLASKLGSVEVHDAPFAELAEVLGGIMVIEAKDYDDAVAIAKTCPHLVHNASMQIRQLDDGSCN